MLYATTGETAAERLQSAPQLRPPAFLDLRHQIAHPGALDAERPADLAAGQAGELASQVDRRHLRLPGPPPRERLHGPAEFLRHGRANLGEPGRGSHPPSP